jgi:hypothetical protein
LLFNQQKRDKNQRRGGILVSLSHNVSALQSPTSKKEPALVHLPSIARIEKEVFNVEPEEFAEKLG